MRSRRGQRERRFRWGRKRRSGLSSQCHQQVESESGDDLSEEGKLADAAVLQLDVTEAVESLLVSPVEHTEGIEATKRRLGTEFALEGHVEGRGGGLLGDGGESGGAGEEGGNNGKLHLDLRKLEEL